jgi:hypothetical protein
VRTRVIADCVDQIFNVLLLGYHDHMLPFRRFKRKS